jgi:hypothetical protein
MTKFAEPMPQVGEVLRLASGILKFNTDEINHFLNTIMKLSKAKSKLCGIVSQVF